MRDELSRRDLMRRGLSCVAPAAWAFRNKAADRDRFGGSLRYRFPASGFFRLEKAGRWWLVTPDGNAFLSFGVNHVAPHLLRQAANQEYWKRKFSAVDPRDPAWMQGYRAKVHQDLAVFGFNTLGTHSATRFYERGFVPYIHDSRFVDIPHWMEPAEKDFLDVFSPQFAQHCDGRALEFCRERAEDPHLIGYSLTDCPIFTDLDAAPRENSIYGAKRSGLPTWPRVLRNLSANHPGKRTYVDAVREIYRGDIAAFNSAYHTDFGSFDALAAASDWRPQTDPANARETRDNHLFLTRVVERYYQVATQSIRRYDRNHMILGDKLNGNTETPDTIIGLAGRYMDLIFYQTFGPYAEQKHHLDRWARLTRKPLFNGDSSYSVPTLEMPDPYGPHCKDQQERARRSLEFAESAFARPDFVGWSHCGWMDGSTRLPGQSLKQHAGLQTAMGEHHEPMRRAFADFSERLYVVALR